MHDKYRKEFSRCPIAALIADERLGEATSRNANDSARAIVSNNANNNANNNARAIVNHNVSFGKKVTDKGVSAMSANDAREMDHRSKTDECKTCGDGVDQTGSGGGEEEAKVSQPVKIPDKVTQFRWATLKLGAPAPGFRGTAVVNGDFEEIALEDYLGKWVIFFFYPLDFTFVCPTEIIAFSEKFPEFEALNCAVVACSTDSHFSHLAWVNTPRNRGGLGDMQIPILADKTGDIARRWGVMKEDEGVTFRGLFIIDPAGNLRQITINDMMVGRCIEETLRLLQAFQFTDENGEVCPMNWKPGDKTIKPNPKDAQEFFNQTTHIC